VTVVPSVHVIVFTPSVVSTLQLVPSAPAATVALVPSGQEIVETPEAVLTVQGSPSLPLLPEQPARRRS
jgi:hypothetical protein